VVLFHLEEVFSYPNVKIYAGLTLTSNFFLWLLAKYVVSVIDEDQIALHYTVDFGIDYFGSYEKIYIMPLLGLVIFIINFTLSALMARAQDIRLVSHITLASALIANLFLVAAVASVYLINVR
jgi:hypothetical protein